MSFPKISYPKDAITLELPKKYEDGACKMNDRKQQLNDELEQLKQREEAGVSLSERAVIEERRGVINSELTEINNQETLAAEKEQLNQEHDKRVSDSLTIADRHLERLDLKEYVGEGTEFELLKIKFKRIFMAQTEESSNQLKEANEAFNTQIRAAQEREIQLKQQNDELQQQIQQLQQRVNQAELELDDAVKKRDAARVELEESKQQIKQLEGWNQDLRTAAAIGVSGSLTVIDDEEMKRQEADLENQRKRERTIYDVQWVDEIRKNRKKAKLAATGEEIEFPWTEATKYFVIDESEVSQFREQYAIQLDVEIPSVDQKSVQGDKTIESQFPITPSVETVQPTVTERTQQLGKQLADRALEEPATKEWVLKQIAELELRIAG